MIADGVKPATDLYARDVVRARLGIRLAVVVLVGLWVSVAMAAPASAHAVLLSSEPADGAELDERPSEVLLQFNEPVELPEQALRVFDANGERVDRGDVGHGDDLSQIRVGLDEQIVEGVYVASWRVISADTHPVSGSLVFTLGAGGQQTVDEELFAFDDGDSASGVVATVGRWVMYAGSLLAVGGAAFLLFVGRKDDQHSPRLRQVVFVAAAIGAASTLIGIPLQAAEASGLGLSAAFDPAAIEQAASGSLGVAALLRLAGLVVAVIGVAAISAVFGAPAIMLGGLLVVGSFLATGHTITSEPQLVVMVANALHTTAAAVWFGGLVMLGLVLRTRKASDDPDGAAGVVARFSTMALVSVGAVAAAGVALSWVEVRAWQALFTTTYGWTLVVKVAVVAIVLAIAAYNRNKLVPAVQRSSEGWATLRRTVSFEVVGVVAVLAVTAALVTIAPARVEAGIGEPVVASVALGDEHVAEVVVDPAQPGRNEVHMYIFDANGQVADIGETVMVEYSYHEAEIENITREATRVGPGHWLHIGTEMSIPGMWTIDIELLISDFERLGGGLEADLAS